MNGTEGALRLAGYAAVFDVPDRGRDVVRKGAFAGAGAVPLLWQHDAARPVGVVERAEEDGRGLRVLARLAAGSEGAREAASLLRAGALSGLSFGYRVRTSRADRARGLAAKSDVAIAASGTATHVALLDAAGSRLLYVTTCPAQPLVAASTVSFGAWDIEIGDPA
ncbi:HK97 family phage prohead protease [Sphingosinicella sp.]|uniref:HK97 family phage prohead protease n=1 Tax=Sphingosinicella sp. TaxID=1917971 RepID=UPI002636553F|nr:HK97 family phage prohead protease [Sphingosinicella sp.]